MDEVYVSLLNIVSLEVVPHLYMFGSGVQHEIFGNTNSTRAITHERNMGTLLTKVTQRVCDPKQLGATISGSYILGFCGRLSYIDCLREDQETRDELKNWHVPEVDFLSTRHPAKLTSENPRSQREEDVEYQRPSSGVYRRYLKIRLTACRCEVLGDT
jgi:hypothetical protein